MLAQFADVSCACLPAEHLPALAQLRGCPGVVCRQLGENVWVRWEGNDEKLLERLLPIPGVTLYSWREGRWYRLGSVLPAFDVPAEGPVRPLHDLLFPAAIQPITLSAPARTSAQTLGLVADDQPRPATALIASLPELLAWADTVPTARLGKLRAAHHGKLVLVLGQHLPVLASGQRLWGQTVLAPLGFRLEPDLTENTIRAAFALKEGDLLLILQDGAQVVKADILQPLDRAGLRKAALETCA